MQILGKGEEGGVIVLVTDGEENVYPFIADVEPDLIEAQVRVVSIAFGYENWKEDAIHLK